VLNAVDHAGGRIYCEKLHKSPDSAREAPQLLGLLRNSVSHALQRQDRKGLKEAELAGRHALQK
jgi:hypothetical protein